MNAGRISGSGTPDSNKVSPQQAAQEAQKVEKVEEIDPDKRAKQQRFQQLMQEGEIKGKREREEPLSPSPFETAFHSSDNQEDVKLGSKKLPSPSDSKPPHLPPTSQKLRTDKDLPQSQQFWHDVDLPDQPPAKPQIKKELEVGQAGKPQKVDASPFEKKEEEKLPSGRYWTPEGEQPSQTTRGAKSVSLDATKNKAAPPSVSEEKLEAPEWTRAQAEERGRGKKDREKKEIKGTEIIAPSLPGLPPGVQPMAVQATEAASPYLRPESIPLFYQMVGSILVMATSPRGVNRTEFVLNNPAFAKSKFFGATIELTKYSTAPDSFNIRFSGTNEAVAAFNQHVPSLTAAFKEGNFQFRVGRIDVGYKDTK